MLRVSVSLWWKVQWEELNYNRVYPIKLLFGDYIFVLPNSTDKSLKHELGHSYQSQLLGWLYIPVVAIPSILHNLVHYIAYKLGKEWDYYSFYTEKWADKLVEKVG